MKPNCWNAIFFAGALMSCKSAGEDHALAQRGDQRGDPGTMLQVNGGSVTTAFPEGRLSASVSLDAFSISKAPITLAEFRSCVSAGACRWSSADCANPDGADGDVAQCVGFEAAKSYCEWVDGDLPTLAQWLLAARGPSVRRFPWGSDPPTCDQHPRASASIRPASREEAENGLGCGVKPERLLRTGKHPDGASPAGLEDVLLSAGELVRGAASSVFSVCLGDDRGCVVYGLVPGAIDAVERVALEDESSADTKVVVPHPYGFRCVTAGETK